KEHRCCHHHTLRAGCAFRIALAGHAVPLKVTVCCEQQQILPVRCPLSTTHARCSGCKPSLTGTEGEQRHDTDEPGLTRTTVFQSHSSSRPLATRGGSTTFQRSRQ